MNSIQLITVKSTHSDLAHLISKLDAYLEELYPPEEIFKVDFNNPKLETKARELAYVAIKLETGDQLFEAISFYKKQGFIAIEKYGEYVNCESSICYEKTL